MSFKNPLYSAQTSVVGPITLLEAVKNSEKDIKYYQASSSEMFGGVDKSSLNESSKFTPKSPYAVGKVFAHEITKVYRESYDIFAVNGILFNHESPFRGETFVTRKITRAVGRIKNNLQNKLTLGNLDAYRDWGFAGDYVNGMYMMMQHSKPDDWVLATGETHSVREFAKIAFDEAGLNYEDYVVTDSKYQRPNEVNHLLGDPSKAKNELGWKLGDEGRNYWLDDINNRGQSREDVLANIRRSPEYACAQSGGSWDGSECKQALAPCPEGQMRPPGGTSCTPIPTNCPEGTAWDGTSCRPTGVIDEHVCPDGSIVSDASQCPAPEAPCPSGQTRNAQGECVGSDAPAPCPEGQSRGADGNCAPIGGGEEPPSTAPCPNGQTRDPDGTCPEAGTYMGPDPNEKTEGDGKLPGEWMGDQNSDNEYERLYNDKAKEMIRLYGGDEGGSAANDRYNQLQSDYDDARREADSYINANRDEELSKLRRGITVGGFPGSRRNDLSSGGTAYSERNDRSRRRNRITAGPRVKDDRPYARRGMKGGYSSGSTYFDSASSF